MNSKLRMVLSSLVTVTSIAAAPLAYAGDASQDEAAIAASEADGSEAELASGCSYGTGVRYVDIYRPVNGVSTRIGKFRLMRSDCGLYARLEAANGYAGYFYDAYASLETSGGSYIVGTSNYWVSEAVAYKAGVRGRLSFSYYDGSKWVYNQSVITGSST